MRNSRKFSAAAALVTVLVLSGCSGSGDSAAPSATTASTTAPATTAPAANGVTIRTFAFQPNPVKVAVGTTVTWTNTDQILHTVTSGMRGQPDGMFDQKLDGVGSTATFTFGSAGTFSYHCSIHPGMDASVEVT